MSPWGAFYVPAELDIESATDLVETLARENVRYLLRTPDAPLLYRSGAFYREQPELWLAIPHALVAVWTGRGLDCKSLAAWRCAEVRVRGGDWRARCIVTEHHAPDGKVYHVRVVRGDGRVEDPSAVLGMNTVSAQVLARPQLSQVAFAPMWAPYYALGRSA